MSVIFLSYRRNDSRHVALNVYNWLIQSGIASEDIFFDQSPASNQYGKRFPESIQTALQSAKIMLVLIGPTWATETRPGWFHKPRIMEERDWVRLEIATALRLGIPILPVRIDDTAMPTAQRVPASIRQLCTIHACGLPTDVAGFEFNMRTIAETIAPHMQAIYHLANNHFTDLLRARRDYLTRLHERYQQIELPVGNVRLSLNAIFQPLKLRRDPIIAERRDEANRLPFLDERPRDDGSQLERASEDSDHSDTGKPSAIEGPDATTAAEKRKVHGDVLADSGAEALRQTATRRMVVLGGPGTGKSTVLANFVAQAAHRALNDPTAPIPIYISLPELARTGQWSRAELRSFLATRLATLDAVPDYASTLRDLIASGQAFLCLDSLDEVGPQIRPQILAWIKALPEPAGDGAVVIGSRFTEYKGGEFKDEQFYEWELQPFDHAVRVALASTLIPLLDEAISATRSSASHHPSVSGEQPQTSPPSAPSQVIAAVRGPDAFVSLLERHPRAAAWSENPLLFTLAAYVYCEHGELPSQRVDLYHAIITAILRDPARRTETNEAEFKTTHDIIAGVALELFARKGRTFSADELTDALRPLCMALGVTDQRIASKYDRLVASGLLDNVARHVFGFRHLTFQEYLAASALAWRLTEPTGMWRQSDSPTLLADTWAFIRKKRGMSRWSEILRLMTGVLARDHGERGRQVARQWLEELAFLHTTREGDPGYVSLTLAAESLAELPLEQTTAISHEGQLAQVIIDTWSQALRRMAIAGRQAHVEKLVGVPSYLAALPPAIVHSSLSRLAKWTRLGYPLTLRVSALLALGHFRALASVALYFELMSDEEFEVRNAVSLNFELLGADAPLERLMSLLTNGTPPERECAAWSLGRLKNGATVEPLMTMAHEPGERRSAALWALDRMRDYVPLDFFLSYLDDSDQMVRYEAVRAVRDRPDEVPVELFVPLAADPFWRVRAEVALALGNRPAQAPTEPLVGLLTDSDDDVRANAIWALGQMPRRAPVEPLLPLLLDKQPRIRSAALAALRNMGDRVPSAPLVHLLHEMYSGSLEGVDGGSQIEVWRTLVGTFPGSDRERFERLQEVISTLYGEVFGDIGSRALASLQRLRLQRLPLPHVVEFVSAVAMPEYQLQALRALVWLDVRIPLETLQPFLSSDDDDLRLEAVFALSAHSDDPPLDLLHHYLRNDADGPVRSAAAWVLGKIGSPSSRAYLIEALTDPAPIVRDRAAIALGDIDADIPAAPLLAALAASQIREASRATDPGADDPDSVDGFDEASVRVALLWALSSSAFSVTADELAPYLTDSSSKVRLQALGAYNAHDILLPSSLLVSALHDEDKDVQNYAREVVKTRGHGALEALIDGVGDQRLDARLPELDLLKSMDPLSYEQLAPFIRMPHSLHRRAAVWTCWMHSIAVPADDLLLVFADPDTRVRILALHLLENRIPGISPIDPTTGKRGYLMPWDGGPSDDVSHLVEDRFRLRLYFFRSPFGGIVLPFYNGSLLSVLFNPETADDRLFLVLLLLEPLPLNSSSATDAIQQARTSTVTDDAPSQRSASETDEASASALAAGWWWRAMALLGRDHTNDQARYTALSLAFEDDSAHVRAVAAWLATRSDDLSLVERALEDDEDLVRAAVLLALQPSSAPAVRAHVLNLLSDPSLAVRYLAAQRMNDALSAVSAEEFSEALIHSVAEPTEPQTQEDGNGDEMQSTRATMPVPYRERLLESLETVNATIPLDALAKFLQSPEVSVRYAALHLLASPNLQTPPGETLPLLLAALNDSSSYIQCEALKQLSLRAAEVDPATLLPFVTNSEFEVRMAAVEAIGHLGDRAPTDLLVQALDDEAYRVRFAALHTLQERGVHIPASTLERLIHESSSDLRTDAFNQLVRDYPAVTLAKLHTFLAETPNVTALVADARTPVMQPLVDACKADADLMARARPALFAALYDENSVVRVNALDAVLALEEGPPDHELRNALRQCATDKHVPVAQRALEKMRELDIPIPLRTLDDATDSSSPDIRREALRCYAAQQVDLIDDILAQTVRDTNALVRYDTLEYVRQYGASATLELAIEALADTAAVQFVQDGAQVKTTIADFAYGVLRDRAKEAFPALIRALGHANENVRLRSFQLMDEVLKEEGGSIPELALQHALGDSDERVADLALDLMSRLVVENETEERQRETLVQELTAILRGERTTSVIDTSSRSQIADALVHSWFLYTFDSVIDYLEKSLNDPMWSVRRSAAHTLGIIQRKAPESAILRLYALRHDPESLAVQIAADDALVRILSVDTIEDD